MGRCVGMLTFGLLLSTAAVATPPDLKTPAPVIYLADNLDEKDRLGFCIDTVGRGLSDRLHAHSCKPLGGDVQFRFDGESGHIESVTFAGRCAALQRPPAVGVTLDLVACADDPLQRFAHDASDGTFRPSDRQDLCLAAGGTSRQAGPFMARDLLLEQCAATPAERTRWVIR